MSGYQIIFFIPPARPRTTNPQDLHSYPHDDPAVENNRFVVEPAKRRYAVNIKRLTSSIDEVSI